MNNKELISQIQKLKNIKADQEWKSKTRDFLYAKISETKNAPIEENFTTHALAGIKNFFAQPSFAIVLAVALIIGSSLFGVRAINIMPGDSLYIARIISEKAQLAMTFNQGEKTKLGLRFASDRAKQITEVLAQTKLGNESTDQEELIQDFKKEINIVKNKLTEIQIADSQNQDEIFFSADFNKDDKGLNISSPDYSEENSTATEPQEENTNPNDMLVKAEELFNQQDYDGAKQKIKEVDALINNKSTEISTEKTTDTESPTEQAEENPTETAPNDTSPSTSSGQASSTELNQ